MRKGGREGGRKGGREGGREGEREGGREGGRDTLGRQVKRVGQVREGNWIGMKMHPLNYMYSPPPAPVAMRGSAPPIAPHTKHTLH